MNQKTTDLSSFNNSWYNPGNPFKRITWYFFNIFFLKNSFLPFSGLKIFILRVYGANIGQGVVIKPCVNIKYPWNLTIGDHAWIGENCWIDNLARVTIGDHCCLSQGAFLLCGNHNYKKTSFDLIVDRITLENGVWIGAKSIVAPGVVCKSHSVLTAGSVATSHLDSYSVYQGNPAVKIREREIG